MRRVARNPFGACVVRFCMEEFADDEDAPATARNWNHNAAYHRWIRRAVPSGARDLLDVGCGDGRLARELAGPGRRVLGLDPDAEMVRRARELSEAIAGLEFDRADFLTRALPAGGFDFVCFLASLHHMDQAAALGKASDLLRPGGRLVVVGLARASTLREELTGAALVLPAWFGGLRPENAGTAEGMPIADPALGWGESRALARKVLPGVRYRRRLYWRYSLRWTKPAA